MPLDILIIDDSTAIRKVLQRVLRQTKIPIAKVLEAANGSEALSVLAQNSVGLILSDLNMPVMDGLQLLAAVKANAAWKEVPFFMITTEGSQAKVMEAIRLGATGYVLKPFYAEQLEEKLRAALVA
jgi:two-component system chemotaxis response regulator CheY